VPPEECRELRLVFNYPVELKTISRFLEVEAAGRSYAFVAAYADPQPEQAEELSQSPSGLTVDLSRRRALILKMREELPWNTAVSVRLLEGAKPGDEHYGIAAEQRLAFHTLEPFRLEYGEVYDWLPSIEAGLIFNHPLAEQDVAAFLQVQLPGYSVEENLEVYGSAVYLKNLPVDFESSFSLRVGTGLQDIYEQTLDVEEKVDLEVGPAASYVSFRASGNRILEAGFPPVAAVEFQNALSGSYAAGRLDDPFAPLPAGPFNDYRVEEISRNARIFRFIDFSPFLDEQGKGSVFARWKFEVPSWWSEEAYPMNADLRLQVSDLGLSSHIAYNRISVQAASLASGDPVEGAEIIVRGMRGASKRAVSNRRGLVSFAFEPGELSRFTGGSQKNLELEARTESDRLVFQPSGSPSYNWNLGGVFAAERVRPITYLCSDRGIYRPGETLSFYGIDRDLQLGKLRKHLGEYSVKLRQGWYGDNFHASWSGRLSPSGRFWGKLELPEDLEPDVYFLVYERPDGSQIREAPVRIAFFRRVNFTVDLTIPQAIRYMGETAEARFQAKYLAGGSLTAGGWSYWWARRPVVFTPPDPEGLYRGFHFGTFPEYGYYEDYEDYYEELSSAEGSLSGDGTVVATQELSDGEEGRIYEYTVTATVEDIDRQAISRQAGTRVYPSSLLIGARLTPEAESEQSLYFVGEGKSFHLQACLLQPDGKPYEIAGSGTGAGRAGGRIEGRLLRENWKMVRERSIGGRIDTRWVREEIEEKLFSLEPDGKKDSRGRDARGRVCATTRLSTSRVDAYIIELRTVDEQGRAALTRFDFYSTGSGNVLWQRYDEQRIDLVADKPSYGPGEKATLLIKSPLPRGNYLLTVEREGILEEKILDLETSTDTVQIDIAEEHIPIVYVTICSWSGRTAAPPNSPDLPDFGKPRGYFGMQALAVDTEMRAIELELSSSRDSYRPGAEAEVTIRAAWKGQPLEGAEIALIAADRGVLDLIDYHLPDPLSLFYNRYNFPHGVAHFDSRALLLDPVVWKTRDLPGGDKEGEELDQGAARVRKDFRATAVFEPGLVTGADGTVTLRFRLPDQLTTFRTTAVAVKDDLFGLSEDEILVQNPINVRPALPRRMRVGDEAEAGVVLTNLDERRRSVTVSLESELLQIKDREEKRVSIPPGGSREVTFKLSAASPGEAALSFSIDSEVLRERLELSLAVDRSVVWEAATIVGQTERSVQEGLVVPQSFLGDPEEGLQISLDSTLASSLIEAIHFLEIYPYDCLEQRTSKLFAYILYDWLLENSGRIESELEALPPYQTEDGGFSFWQDPGFRYSNYYVSLRAAHLLHLALEKGYSLPPGLDLQALLAYLEQEFAEVGSYLRSYALYVLALHGAGVQGQIQALLESKNLGILEQILLGLASLSLGDVQKAELVLDGIRGAMRVGTRSVTLAGDIDSWIYYGGELQAKAALLLLYGRLQPRSQIAQALANDLLASARKGYWVNTSNTGWILQAFAAYMDTDGQRDTKFSASVNLGDSELVSREFSGVSRKPFSVKIEPAELLEIAKQAKRDRAEDWLPLSIGKEGKGRLYYTATLRYALDGSRVEPRDEGIGIFTEITDPQGDPVKGPLKLGEVYRLHGVVYSSRDRDFLVLRLPLPSGAEAIDGSLSTSQIVRRDEAENGSGYYGPIKRIYDNEVRFIYDTFYRGKRELSFLFRTTTPGTFATPPATAELMYEEEVFGRTAGREFRIAP